MLALQRQVAAFLGEGFRSRLLAGFNGDSLRELNEALELWLTEASSD